MADAYERWLVPTVFRPFAEDLAARVATRSPERILEVGAGTGVLTAALAAATSAAITATDFNEAMVEVGRSVTRGITWQQADAMALPFGPATFDVVTGAFTVMFFPDRRLAFAEARRCLDADGAFVFNTWAALDAHDFQAAVSAALHAFFPDDTPTFMESVPHCYFETDVVRADLEAAGFALTAALPITLLSPPVVAEDIARGYCIGTPVRAEIDSRGAPLEAVVAAVTDAIHARLGADPVVGSMTAMLFAAT